MDPFQQGEILSNVGYSPLIAYMALGSPLPLIPSYISLAYQIVRSF